jgi:hypothetical protein
MNRTLTTFTSFVVKVWLFMTAESDPEGDAILFT